MNEPVSTVPHGGERHPDSGEAPGDGPRSSWTWLLLAACLAIAVALRVSLFGFEGNDFRYFMGPWYDYIASHGGFRAMGSAFSDYSPPYLYLLAVATILPVGKLYAIKLVSVVFDFVLAAGVGLIVREVRRGTLLPACAFLATLFAPTVVLNSALWGQNDAIFAAFLVLCVLFLVRERGAAAMLMYGIAFAFKAQAVFLGPLLLVLLLERRLKLAQALLAPAAYLVLMIPAWVAGRPLVELLLVYFRQAGEYKHLTMGAPNIYQWLPDNYALFRTPGLLLTSAVALGIAVLALAARGREDAAAIVRLALVSLLAVPFCLPGMHERYFFPADVLAVAFAFLVPRLFWVPLAVGLVSTFAYVPFLFGITVLPSPVLAIALLAVIAVVGGDWLRSLRLLRPARERTGE
jgi:Gpi18-like mannosyltransferase